MKKEKIRNYEEINALLDKNDPIEAFLLFVKMKYPKLDSDKIQSVIETLYELLKDVNLYELPFIMTTGFYNTNKDSFVENEISLFEFQLVLCLVTDFLICCYDRKKKLVWPFLTEEQNDWMNKAILLLSSHYVSKKNESIFDKKEKELIDYAEKQKDKLTNKDKNYKWQFSDAYAMWSVYGKPIDYRRFEKMSKFMNDKTAIIGNIPFVKKGEEIKNEIVLASNTPNVQTVNIGQIEQKPSKFKKVMFVTLILGLIGVGGYYIWKARKET